MKKFNFKKILKKSSLLRGLFLIIPYLLVAVFVFCTATFGFEEFSKSSVALSTVVNEVKEENDASNDKFERLTYVDQDFPTLAYLKVWSLLNVDGWNKKDIPVYYGDTNSILMKGVGMWDGSNFCGQNGCTVISGHVTTYFREIEETEVGAKVTMDTVYGTYLYEVSSIEIFSPGKAAELILRTFDSETLIIYTCYPYNSRNRTQRIALICTKVEGKAFREYAS